MARHLRPSDVDANTVLASGFKYKRHPNGELKEEELSVNWLEFFNKHSSIKENIQKVRLAFEAKGYELKKNGRFIALNIKSMREEVEKGTAEHTESVSLIAKHSTQENDMSHSSIIGMPFDSEGELLVSTILANCANETELYPAKI